MHAILLAGGYGTRLFPITLRTPKPLLPVAGKPVLVYSIEMLKAAGITNISISVKENQTKIENYLGDGNKYGVKIDYIYEPETTEEKKLGSVGALNFVFSKIPHVEEALVLGGDNLILGFNMQEFQKHHKSTSSHASIGLFELSTKDEAQHFGVAQIDQKSGKILQFQEKPQPSKAVSKLASTAIYCLEKSFIKEHLPKYAKFKHSKGEKADKIGDLWAHYIHDLKISGFPFVGVWGDIGNCEGYIKTNKLAFEHFKKLAGKEILQISKTAKIAKSAKIIAPAIIEDNCDIGENSVVGPNVHLLHGSKIGNNAHISNSVIFENCIISKQCKIEHSLIDGGCVIGFDSHIANNTMLGYKCKIGDSCRLSKIIIFPKTQIKDGFKIQNQSFENDFTPQSKEMVESCFWK
ncbi:NDP-sugar synthase [Candidatus Micrarchaeota archaeon]|nr:NDP-sugar synthase [Candidatus Micrarchaeota archaeon]